MKRSRAYRIKTKEKIIKKRLKLVKNIEPCRVEHFQSKMNYLSTHDPFDCGKTQCGLCRTCKKQHKKDLKRKQPLEDNEDG